MDLSRPINFNPGPGAYLRDMEDLKKKLNMSMNSEEGMLKRKARERVLRSIEVDNRYGNH